MKRPHFISALALAVLAGFVAGRLSHHAEVSGKPVAAVGPVRPPTLSTRSDPGTATSANLEMLSRRQIAVCPPGGESAWVASAIRRAMLGFGKATDFPRLMMEFAMITPKQFPLVLDEWKQQSAELKVEGDPDDTDFVNYLGDLLMTCWAESDPTAALARLEQSPENLKNQRMLNATFAGLVHSDINAATAALARLEGGARSSAVAALTMEFAGTDPERALLFAISMNDRGAERAAEAAAQRLAATNPARAADLAGALASTAAGSDALKKVAESWGKSDFLAAEAWGRSWQGPARIEFLATVLGHATEIDPNRVAAALPGLLAGYTNQPGPDAKALTSLTGKVADELLKTRSLEEMVAWTGQLPEGPARAGAQSTLAKEWLNRDTVAASEWIAQLPAGRARDYSVVPLILKIKEAEPADALEWAGTLADPGVRNHWQTDILENWEKHAPEAARAARAALAQE